MPADTGPLTAEQLQDTYDQVSRGVDQPDLVLFEGKMITKKGVFHMGSGEELTAEEYEAFAARLKEFENGR